MKNKVGYILFGVIIVAYVVCCFFGDIEYISEIITTLTAVIGALVIWWQLKSQRDLTEAGFIMDYNTAFIANAELTKIEKSLEEYRTTKEFTIDSSNRQSIINYLVYHEALAAIIFRGVLTIKNIDDLFMYRFFLAVNNPIVQENELCADAQYYRGCFKLYKKWSTYRKKEGLSILLEETSLDKTAEYKKYAKS